MLYLEKGLYLDIFWKFITYVDECTNVFFNKIQLRKFCNLTWKFII